MSEQEEWRLIDGFPDYRVSSLGRVASVKRDVFRVLSGGKTDRGYRNVLLYNNGQRSGHRVHALVAAAFHGPRPEGLEIRHLDGDQLNNAASNLAYGTHSENIRDRARHGYRHQKNATDCPHSASLPDSAVYRIPGKTKRYCKTCKSARDRGLRRNAALRAARNEAAA